MIHLIVQRFGLDRGLVRCAIKALSGLVIKLDYYAFGFRLNSDRSICWQ
jgi:hypothetical protein